MPRPPVARGALFVTLAIVAFSLSLMIDSPERQEAAAQGSKAASENLVRNASLEDGVLFTPTGWDTTVSGLPTVSFEWAEGEARTGERSLYVFNASDAVAMWHNWNQTILDVQSFAGKELVLKAWIKTEQIQGKAYLFLQAYSDTITIEAVRTGTPRQEMRVKMGYKPIEDPQTELGWSRKYFSTNVAEWTPIEVSLFIPPTTNLIMVRAGIFGAGRVWFDDFEMVSRPAAKESQIKPGKNLMVNPGFEQGLDGWDFSLAPMEGLRIRTSDIAHSGKKSAMMSSQGRPPLQMLSMYFQVLNTRQLSGKKVRLSAWLRTEDFQSKAYIRIFGTGTYGDFRPVASRAIGGTTDWTLVSTEATFPEDTYVVWAQAGMDTNVGTIWVDDVSFELVEESN